ncbi:MAG: PIN domain nuclease [Deltaproteobacteria bacterium]|nr:PIN domain nuclease [Deltaproteobacteria bacterium]
MILIDSSVWIPFFNAQNNPRVEAMMTLIRDDEDVCLSFHILMEILQGFRVDKDYQQVLGCLLMFPIVDMGGMSSYIAAAQIYRQCRKKGITIRKGMDCIIAQTAVENKLILLHDDADFDRIASVIPLQLYTEKK